MLALTLYNHFINTNLVKPSTVARFQKKDKETGGGYQ